MKHREGHSLYELVSGSAANASVVDCSSQCWLSVGLGKTGVQPMDSQELGSVSTNKKNI